MSDICELFERDWCLKEEVASKWQQVGECIDEIIQEKVPSYSLTLDKHEVLDMVGHLDLAQVVSFSGGKLVPASRVVDGWKKTSQLGHAGIKEWCLLVELLVQVLTDVNFVSTKISRHIEQKWELFHSRPPPPPVLPLLHINITT